MLEHFNIPFLNIFAILSLWFLLIILWVIKCRGEWLRYWRWLTVRLNMGERVQRGMGHPIRCGSNSSSPRTFVVAHPLPGTLYAYSYVFTRFWHMFHIYKSDIHTYVSDIHGTLSILAIFYYFWRSTFFNVIRLCFWLLVSLGIERVETWVHHSQ